MKLQRIQFTVTLLFLTTILLRSPSISYATTVYQRCEQDSSCVVGEFLFDDSYVPIATASCTLTSRYPDGSVFINSAATGSTSDGWYSYTVEATGSAGLYRSQLCCTANSDYLCLDKSFTVEAASSSSGTTLTKSDVSDAVWNASRASYTQAGSFGEAVQNVIPSASSIAEAVWGYSSRNLSGFGSLVSDLWGYTTRTTTSSTSDPLAAKKTDVDSLSKEVLYNQSLLEKIVNKPLIKNYLEEEPDIDLESKLNQSEFLLSKLTVDSYAMDSKLGKIDSEWVSIDSEQLLATVKEVADLHVSITESTSKLKDMWNLEVATTIFNHTDSLKNRIAVIQNEFEIEKKSRIGLEDIRSLHASLEGVITPLGTTKDPAGTNTLFGKIREIKEVADALDLYSSDTAKLLNSWTSLEITDIQKKTNFIANELAKINKLPGSILVISSPASNDVDKKLKNRVLSIQGTIAANKILLAKKTAAPFSSSWLEEGSVIFKTLLTNPSTKISQHVPLKYYLPPEIKKENIIEVDDGLKTNYDVEKKQLYVEGEFTLAPFESKVVSVRVEDIWIIPESNLSSLRQQAEELAKPLAKTSYFGQSVTIKSNITVALDKIAQNQKSAITPEAKIKNYYEAQIELKAVDEQLAKLQDMLTQSGSMSSLAGFVGGAQAIAVWGLIIIMVTGFVFLVLYMRVIRGRESPPSEPKTKPLSHDPLEVLAPMRATEPPKPRRVHHGHSIRFAGIIAMVGALTTLMVGGGYYVLRQKNPESSVRVASQSNANPELIKKPDEGMVMGTQSAKLVESPQQLKVKQTPTNYLNVRSKPSSTADVIAKVLPGETYVYSQVSDGWYQIKLKDGNLGWVSGVWITTLK